MRKRRPYLVLLVCGLLAQTVEWQRTEIDATPPKNPWIKAVGDLDGDSRLDVIIGGSAGPLVWYRNPTWSRSVIAEGGYDSVDGEAADLDGDGDLDVVVGGVLWYENPRPEGDPASGPWKAHRIGSHRTHDVEVADIDLDGRLDVVVRGQTGFKHKEGHRILIFRRDASGQWTSREIRCPEGEGLRLADLDADGDADIVIGGRWYENPGRRQEHDWREHVYSVTYAYGECKVATGDLNGDGRVDILLAPAEYKGGSYRIAWFEAPARAGTVPWREHIVEARIESVVHAAGIADLNGDGAADIVTAMMHQGAGPQSVSVYWNKQRGRQWQRQTLSERGSHNIVLADLDGDGAVDILGANHGGPFQPVEWWRKAR